MKSNTTIVYQSGRFTVTPAVVRSAGDAYRLGDIAHVRLRRPALPLAIVTATGLAGLTAVFWPELYPAEKLMTIGVAVVLVTVGVVVGRLQLNSLALGERDGVIHGRHGELARLKRAVEQVLSDRSSPPPLAAEGPPISPP